jgi:DNA-directed RNA polymerase subunit RPC12/RpoP
MELKIIKKKTKTKPEIEFNLLNVSKNDLERISYPSHYKIIYNCTKCNKQVVINNFSNWKKKQKEKKSLCASCSIKWEWESESYKSKHIEGLVKICNTEENKIKRSLISSNNWKNNSYRNKTLKNLRVAMQKPEYQEKMRKLGVERWENKDFQEKMYKIFSSKEWKEKQRENNKLRWKDPEFLEKEDKIRYITGLRFNNIYCRSLAEYVYLNMIKDKYKQIEACYFSIPYKDDKNYERRYIPDFKLTTESGEVIIIEVKGGYAKDFGISAELLGRHSKNLNKKIIEKKMEALVDFFGKKKWNCELLTFENKEFAKAYRQERKKRKHESKKNNT